MQQALRAALPKHIKLDAFVRVTLAAMQTNPKLFECSQESILLSLMRAASYGLVPDGGALGHGYLVPFWNGKAKRMDCQFVPGYRGLIKLARNSGEVADVWAEVVYEADMQPPGKFHYELGLDQTLEHKRNDVVEDAGQLLYAYAVARFKDGEKRFVVMNRREVLAIKSKTASRTKEGDVFGPWQDHEGEMWKKTVVRRLSKMLPLSPDVAAAISQDDESEAIDAFSSVSVAAPQLSADSTDTHQLTKPVGFVDSVGLDARAGELNYRDELESTTTISEVEEVRARWQAIIKHEDELDDMELACNKRIAAFDK